MLCSILPTAAMTPGRGALILPGEFITLSFDGTPAEHKTAEEKEKLVPDYMTLARVVGRNIHYLTA